jgi:hypothetical protein
MQLDFTGCDFDIHVLEFDTNNMMGQCTVTCPNEGITGRVARENCNGTGCCSTYVGPSIGGLDIKFARHNMGNREVKAHSKPSSIWNKIDLTIDHAYASWGTTIVSHMG